MFVRRIDDTAGLRAAYEALSAFPRNARGQERDRTVLLESLLAGPEVSVEAVTVDGRTTVVGVTDKTVAGEPSFIEVGHAFPAPVEPELAQGAGALAVDTLAALGIDRGVTHTEVKLTPSGPCVVEVNPRPGGNRITELVRRVTGIDLVAAHVALALGQEPALTPVPTGIGGAAIRFVVPDRDGRVTAMRGACRPAGAPDVVDWEVDDVTGRDVSGAGDNNAYLGRVMVVAGDPAAAAARAAELASGIELVFPDDAV
jgi:argininosuccinate lyase